MRTNAGWSRSAVISRSRTNRSRESVSRRFSTLRATSRRSWTAKARRTVPIPPAPICSRATYSFVDLKGVSGTRHSLSGSAIRSSVHPSKPDVGRPWTSTSGQEVHEFRQLGVQVLRVVHRFGDPVDHDLPELSAQPVDRDLGGGLGEPRLRPDRFVALAIEIE